MKVKFWGVRGSIPIPGSAAVRYGGNTPCIEVKGEQGECIILDAGTGIRALGLDLSKRGRPLPSINVFITHTHWDHIHGFPFFVPCYTPGEKIHVKGPIHYLENRSLQDILDIQMQYEFFPVSSRQLAAEIHYDALNETTLDIGGIRIKTQFMNHSIRCLGYRLSENGRSILYTGDNEPYYNLFDTRDDHQEPEADDDILFGDVEATVEDANKRFVDFLRDVDLFVTDSQYTPDEYPATKRNWGHSSWDYALRWMQDAGADRMVLTHHDPARTDDELDEILGRVHQAARDKEIDPQKIMIAQEGMEISV